MGGSLGQARSLRLWGALLTAWACAVSAAPEDPAQALPPGAMEVALSHGEQVFKPVAGRIGVWETGPLQVTGRSPFRHWTVTCEVTPLTNTAGEGVIPPSRVQVLLEGGPAGATAAAPFAVMQGGVGTRIGPQGATTFRLRVATDWLDPPGRYVGSLRLTYLAIP